jgi:hypothetical protein
MKLARMMIGHGWRIQRQELLSKNSGWRLNNIRGAEITVDAVWVRDRRDSSWKAYDASHKPSCRVATIGWCGPIGTWDTVS